MTYDNIILGIISCPEKEAESLARLMIEKKYAACVQVTSPVTSFFRWKGEVQKEKEVLLYIKTTRTQVYMIKEFLQQHHSYDVPEFLCFSAEDGSEEYVQWIENSFLSDD